MKTTNTMGSQAQNIFVRHVFLLFVGLLFICMIEEVPLRVDPKYSIFKIVFEIASGYGMFSSACSQFLDYDNHL
jgi:Trk-type K+ transport system membrane component